VDVVDNWRHGVLSPLAIHLYGVWADRGRLVTNSEGS
jgi:hypothetical protein